MFETPDCRVRDLLFVILGVVRAVDPIPMDPDVLVAVVELLDAVLLAPLRDELLRRFP